MPRQRTSAEWTEDASATNSNAVATHSAETGNIHYVTGIVAGFTGSGNTASLTLADGSTTILSTEVHDDAYMEFAFPIKLTAGNKAELTLSAGGTGVDGHVTLMGFTRADD